MFFKMVAFLDSFPYRSILGFCPLTVWVNNVTIIKDLDAFAGFPFIQRKNGESGVKMNF